MNALLNLVVSTFSPLQYFKNNDQDRSTKTTLSNCCIYYIRDPIKTSTIDFFCKVKDFKEG